MKKTLLLIALFANPYLLLTVNAQPANINISQTAAFEGEPYLAINPTNHNNIVVAWMADDASTNFRVSIKTKTSFDGGATWTNANVKPHFGTTWYSADVSMQFRNNGMLYLSYIDYHETPDSGGVYCTHSANGGITWSAPTQIWNGITEDPTKRPLDRPWLAADNSGTATDGMFYLTTKPAPWIAPPNRPYLKTSTDSGQTWSTYRYVDTANYLVGNLISAPMAALTVAPDGALCIAYPSYLNSQSVYPKFFFAKSYNRGASFQYHDLIVNPIPLATADSSYKAGYNLAANPTNPNQFAFAGLSGINGDPDVYITTTNDGGITWSSLVRVNDDPIGNGVGQDLVWASYDGNNNLVVVWRDRRNGGGSGYAQNTDTYCAVSHDNGATFQPNVRIISVSAAYAAILLQKGNDFMSCQLLNDTIYAAWGDVRTGNLNIFFAKVSVSSGTVSGIVPIDAEDENGISIYPNPTKQQFYITTNNKELKQISLFIYDEKGTLVFSKEITNTIEPIGIGIPNLSSGIYFIGASGDGKKLYDKKMVVE